MTQAIMQAVIETDKTAIIVRREAYDPVNNARWVNAAPRWGKPVQKQPPIGLDSSRQISRNVQLWNRDKEHFHD